MAIQRLQRLNRTSGISVFTVVIIFKDKKGKEDLALSGFLIRLGNHNGEHLQIDRAQSKTAISFSGKKGSAFVGLIKGQPAVTLSDAKDLNHVGMTEREAGFSVDHAQR